MKIGIPVAHFHEGNTAEYVQRALSKMGHQGVLLTPVQFYSVAQDPTFSFFLCVDSGEPLSFEPLLRSQKIFQRIAFWFIDFRHNKERATRVPNDLQNARLLQDLGGWIFQAQREDVEACQSVGIERCSWLPMAADSEIWSDLPKLDKRFEVGFVGSLWDNVRVEALRAIHSAGLQLAFSGHRKLWKDKAAQMLRASKIGFNISSFYGTPVAFDINMRFFETLSCGIPMVSNEAPSLSYIVPAECRYIKRYRSFEEIVPLLRESLEDEVFLNAGPDARNFILEAHTYQHRMQQAIKIVSENLEII